MEVIQLSLAGALLSQRRSAWYSAFFCGLLGGRCGRANGDATHRAVLTAVQARRRRRGGYLCPILCFEGEYTIEEYLAALMVEIGR